MEINCEICKKLFKISPSRTKNNKHHTCSRACMGKLNSQLYSKKIQTNCSYCNKIIYYKLSRFKQTINPCCSQACRARLIVQKKLYNGNNNPKALKLTKEERIFYNRCQNTKNRALQKNIEHDIDYKFLQYLFTKQKGLCYYSNYPMKLVSDKKEKLADFDVFSVDRINSSKGYTKDNVVLCLNSLNRFKGDLDMPIFLEILNSIFNKLNLGVKCNIKKLYNDAKLPTKQRIQDAGYDVYAHRIEDCGNYIKVFSGIAIQPESNHYFILVPRSSIYKYGLTLYNNVGIIDKNYLGEIIGIFYKTKDFKELPKKDDRLFQLIPQKQINIICEEVEELTPTERAENGFGSSGR